MFDDNSYIFSKFDSDDLIIEKRNEFQILKSFADIEKLKVENAEEYEYFLLRRKHC